MAEKKARSAAWLLVCRGFSACSRAAFRVIYHPFDALVQFVRARIVAYLLVFTVIALALSIMQYNTNNHLAQADYDACVGRREILVKANDKMFRTNLLILALVDDDQRPIYEAVVERIKPYELPNCEPLKP